jgi:cyanate permease
MDCFFALAGILAPSITGILTDATGNFNAAFMLLMVLNLMGVISILIFQHPDKHIKVR